MVMESMVESGLESRLESVESVESTPEGMAVESIHYAAQKVAYFLAFGQSTR